MSNKFRFCFLLCTVFATSSCFCTFGRAEELSAVNILNHYKYSLFWTKFVSMRMEVVFVSGDDNDPFKNNKRDFIFRRDHDRAEWIGQYSVFDPNGKLNTFNSHIIKHIATGKNYWYLERGVIAFPPSKFFHMAMKQEDCKTALKNTLGRPVMGAALFGNPFSGTDGKGVIELLSEAENLNLHNNMEVINGISCYVLEGVTDYGKVTVWIAPEKGYSALKWILEKTPEVMFDGKYLSDIWPEIQSTAETFDSMEIEQVSDSNGNTAFIPRKARYTSTVVFTNGKKTTDLVEYTVTNIQLNPDFEALGAFEVDFPNGTQVYIEEYPGVRYKWQDGKIVPDVDTPMFEEIDNIVENLKNECPADSNEN